MLNRTRLTHAKLGPPPGTGRYHTLPSPPLNTQTQAISVRTDEWNIRLQHSTHIYPRHQNTSAWKNTQQEHLGITRTMGMVCTPRNSPLSLPYICKYPRQSHNASQIKRISYQFKINSQYFQQRMQWHTRQQTSQRHSRNKLLQDRPHTLEKKYCITAAQQQLEAIFNTAVPQAELPPTPPAELTKIYQTQASPKDEGGGTQ